MVAVETCKKLAALFVIVSAFFGAQIYMDGRHEPAGAAAEVKEDLEEDIILLAGDVKVIKKERALESARRQLRQTEAIMQQQNTPEARAEVRRAKDDYNAAYEAWKKAIAE